MTNEIGIATIVNALNGEVTERELTSDEKAELEKSRLSYEASQAEAQAKATARQSALAKLAALGLTEAEIAAL
jgi:DNA-binding NarL/FixJ family response regulator